MLVLPVVDSRRHWVSRLFSTKYSEFFQVRTPFLSYQRSVFILSLLNHFITYRNGTIFIPYTYEAQCKWKLVTPFAGVIIKINMHVQ